MYAGLLLVQPAVPALVLDAVQAVEPVLVLRSSRLVEVHELAAIGFIAGGGAHGGGPVHLQPIGDAEGVVAAHLVHTHLVLPEGVPTGIHQIGRIVEMIAIVLPELVGADVGHHGGEGHLVTLAQLQGGTAEQGALRAELPGLEVVVDERDVQRVHDPVLPVAVPVLVPVVGTGQYVQLHPFAQAETGGTVQPEVQVGTGGAGGGIEVLAERAHLAVQLGVPAGEGGRQVARTIIETPEVGGTPVVAAEVLEGGLGVQPTAHAYAQHRLVGGLLGADVDGAAGEITVQFRGEGLVHRQAAHDRRGEDVQRGHLGIRVRRRQRQAVQVGGVVTIAHAAHHQVAVAHHGEAHDLLHAVGHVVGTLLLQFLRADVLDQRGRLLAVHQQHGLALAVYLLHHLELLDVDGAAAHAMVQPGDLAGAYHHVACGVGPESHEAEHHGVGACLHGQLVVAVQIGGGAHGGARHQHVGEGDWLLLPGLAFGKPSLDGARLGPERRGQQQQGANGEDVLQRHADDLGERLVNDLLPLAPQRSRGGSSIALAPHYRIVKPRGRLTPKGLPPRAPTHNAPPFPVPSAGPRGARKRGTAPATGRSGRPPAAPSTGVRARVPSVPHGGAKAPSRALHRASAWQGVPGFPSGRAHRWTYLPPNSRARLPRTTPGVPNLPGPWQPAPLRTRAAAGWPRRTRPGTAPPSPTPANPVPVPRAKTSGVTWQGRPWRSSRCSTSRAGWARRPRP